MAFCVGNLYMGLNVRRFQQAMAECFAPFSPAIGVFVMIYITEQQSDVRSCAQSAETETHRLEMRDLGPVDY